jgi:quinol-cytochrome oxidoreductase complex cytochrome b subunit
MLTWKPEDDLLLQRLAAEYRTWQIVFNITSLAYLIVLTIIARITLAPILNDGIWMVERLFGCVVLAFCFFVVRYLCAGVQERLDDIEDRMKRGCNGQLR